jgi:prepilin-type N-terminal cleavage/methylation domain-containing protein
MNKDPVKEHIFSELRSRKGFTLLELILSITILSLVALIIGSGFRLGLQAWERGNKELHSTQRLRALSGLMLQDLKSVYPYKMEIDDDKVILFEGEENSILFVSTLGNSSQGGLKWVKYSYDDDDRSLSYSEGILPDKEVLETVSDDRRSEIVDDDMVKMSFEYYSSEEEDWSDTWDIGEEMPLAVRIHMEHYPSLFITFPMSPEKDKKDREKNEGMFGRF